MQCFFIGLGASLAGTLPMLFRYLGVEGTTPSGIPLTVKYSFQVGAVAFLGGVLWTVLTTGEYPAGGHGGVRADEARAARALRPRRARSSPRCARCRAR